MRPPSKWPPFAPAYGRLTYRLVSFTQPLAQVMCPADVARFTGLGWDTVKELVQKRLEADFGRPDLRGLRYLSIDEIYVGKAREFYTVVINLEDGRVVWVARGKGAAALAQFWPLLRQAGAMIRAVCCDLSAAYCKRSAKHLCSAIA